jgi:hypothetical protein
MYLQPVIPRTAMRPGVFRGSSLPISSTILASNPVTALPVAPGFMFSSLEEIKM